VERKKELFLVNVDETFILAFQNVFVWKSYELKFCVKLQIDFFV